jgi:hypothetical protein
MKRNNRVLILLASIVFTSLGSYLKITGLSEALLAIGIVTFIVAMVMILRRLFTN